MELRDVLQSNSAVREFSDRAVTDATLHEILDTARFAPSGGNRQPWHVVVIRDQSARRRLRDLYVLAWREYMAHVNAGLVAFAPTDRGRFAGPAIDLEAARATPSPLPFADHLDQTPVLLAIVADLDQLAVMDNGLDRQSIVGGASVYPFANNILLAACEAGLGGVMTTVLCRQEHEVRPLIGMHDGQALAALLALGYPASPRRRIRRGLVESFTTIDRLDGPPFVP